MDKVITIYDAKTNFSKLVKKAKAGETIYIGSYGKEEVMLIPAVPRKKGLDLSNWEGVKISYDDDIFKPDLELKKLMEDGPIFPDESL